VYFCSSHQNTTKVTKGKPSPAKRMKPAASKLQHLFKTVRQPQTTEQPPKPATAEPFAALCDIYQRLAPEYHRLLSTRVLQQDYGQLKAVTAQFRKFLETKGFVNLPQLR
jgi:hypothetical protein